MFLCGIIVCLSVPTVIKVILISFVAGCQTYLLYALRQRKRRVYRFTAVLGIGFFLLGIARIWYMQQQSYTIETILKEQETSLSVETDASGGWQTENEKTILQGKIEKKERKTIRQDYILIMFSYGLEITPIKPILSWFE